MGWFSIAILGGIGVVGIGVWLEWRIAHVSRRLEQFIKLTPKRHAELLDLERRQQDDA
jgi:hypothetical protein